MTNQRREELKKEAVQRMKAMEIIEDTILQFEKEDLVSFSRNGGNFWLSDQMKQLVTDFEEHNNALVYFSILSNTTIGQMLSLFYVSEDSTTWPDDWGELSLGYQFVYVHNLTTPDFSEFGTIAFRPFFGGLIRTA